MKFLYTVLICGLFLSTLNAQYGLHPDFEKTYLNNNWVKIKKEVQIPTEAFFNRYNLELGLNKASDLKIYKSKTDALGFTHHRAKQYHQGYPVDGAEYILHAKNGFVTHANGRLVKGEFPAAATQIDEQQAIQAALNYINAPQYYWQIPGMEALVKRIKKDPEATFYPTPELVWADPDYSQIGEQYTLTWKMEIFASDPYGSKEVFVDARNGEVLYTLDKCQHNNEVGTAETRYHGTQEIITTKVSDSLYHLRDYTRGSGIETYDMNKGSDVSEAVDFEDDDNYWDNANADFDEVGTDVHWGMEKTYDYYFLEQGRDSYDDEGGLVISYVHVNNNWFNASWNGMFSRFGDGNGNPLTSIDVVSHELTHGVTDYTSDLIYRNESGALNESFSDIFGNVVEYYALGDEADWLIGKVNFTLRSMSNPNSYGHPDTYLGVSWFTGSGDNGGVHTNSGVQNFWFYLLSEGGTGINDNGDDYEVDGLGIYNAADIAYRNLAFYLTPSSNHLDARLGALQSAEDIYGSCSPEVVQTAKAWHAVGVGADNISKDLRMLSVSAPQSSCIDGNPADLTMTFRLDPSGCSFELDAGTTIKVGYRVNDDSPVVEDLVLANSLQENETIEYTFNTPVELYEPGSYEIDFWVNLDDDAFQLNDTIFDHLARRPEVINRDQTITFEARNDNISLDSFYLTQGELANNTLIFSAQAANGIRFASMTGSRIPDIDELDIPTTQEEVFTLNTEYNSSICLCVDLTEWDEAFMDFELQQIWSRIHPEDYDIQSSDLVTGMRILIDDVQVGDSYHPTLHQNFEWETQTVDLSDFVGSSFQLCFEGKHFYDRQNDFKANSDGDQTNIDHVKIYGLPLVNVENISSLEGISISPNPSNGQFVLNIDQDLKQSAELIITDALGKVLRSEVISAGGSNQVEIQLSDATPGLYLLKLQSGDQIWTEKLIIQ